MSVLELSESFDVHRYNALFAVEHANRIVRTDGAINDFLESAGHLFVKHGVRSGFGVALLHRHQTCHEGERMIQYPRIVNDEAALVTQPVLKDINPIAAVPWVWAIFDGRLCPMEFTSDEVARDYSLEDGALPREFLKDFIELTGVSPIGHVMGLAIVERALHKQIPDDCLALEYSDERERKSVIFVRSRDVAASTIETTWAFERFITPASGCESTSSCSTVCRTECIEDYGKHSNIHFERHNVVPGHNPTWP